MTLKGKWTVYIKHINQLNVRYLRCSRNRGWLGCTTQIGACRWRDSSWWPSKWYRWITKKHLNKILMSTNQSLPKWLRNLDVSYTTSIIFSPEAIIDRALRHLWKKKKQQQQQISGRPNCPFLFPNIVQRARDNPLPEREATPEAKREIFT